MEREVSGVRAVQLDSPLLLSFASENPHLERSAEETSKHRLPVGLLQAPVCGQALHPRGFAALQKGFPTGKAIRGPGKHWRGAGKRIFQEQRASLSMHEASSWSPLGQRWRHKVGQGLGFPG